MTHSLVKRPAALPTPRDLASLAKPLSLPQAKTNDAKLAALSTLARKAGAGLEFLNQISEARLWNLRRAGEMIHDLLTSEKRGNGVLPRIGVGKMESSRWQSLARLPEGRWRKQIEEIKGAAARELTVADMLAVVRDERRTTRREQAKRVPRPEADAEIVAGSYQCIVIDPPWSTADEGDVDQMGRAQPLYATIPIEQMAEKAPVDKMADKNAHLYLWITNRSLPKGFRLLDEWGFRYVTMLTWCKPSIGIGNYFRGSTEHVLFGVRGQLPLLEQDIGTWFAAPRGKTHSAKPDEFYTMVERASPGPRLDMFYGKKREGWISWGTGE